MRNPYAFLKTKGMVEFVSTSFIRGLTFNDTIFIIDEIQNMTSMELHSIITRIGKNSRFIMCGDYRQNDLIDNKSGQSGIGEIMKVMALIKSVDTVEFNVEDIVRSGIVKEYIIARHKLGLS
jgi:phosphate starvation-inducible protein PhoH